MAVDETTVAQDLHFVNRQESNQAARVLLQTPLASTPVAPNFAAFTLRSLAARLEGAQRRALLPSDDVAHVVAREDNRPVGLDQGFIAGIDLLRDATGWCFPRLPGQPKRRPSCPGHSS